MRRIQFFMYVLCLIPSVLYSQEWAPVGAKWYYSHVDGLSAYLTVMESVKDTVIQHKKCSVLESRRIYREMQPNGDYFWDTTLISRKFVHYNNDDTLFYYKDTVFLPLYVFNAAQGDTVVVEKSSLCESSGEYAYILEYIVDSSTTKHVNNTDLMYVYNSPTNEADFVLSQPEVDNIHPIIEYIGSTKYFFGVYKHAFLEGDINCLRCYTYNDFTYKADSWDRDCDYLPPLESFSSAKKTSVDTEFGIYPNPFDSYVEFQFPGDVTSYTICDMFGHVVYRGTEKTVYLDFLPSGMYFMNIMKHDVCVKTMPLIVK
ncbi:MAG: T9SS type A sorting domain-containing protein [Bacteroidales bacterium]